MEYLIFAAIGGVGLFVLNSIGNTIYGILPSALTGAAGSTQNKIMTALVGGAVIGGVYMIFSHVGFGKKAIDKAL